MYKGYLMHKNAHKDPNVLTVGSEPDGQNQKVIEASERLEEDLLCFLIPHINSIFL
jgi:hypothetical protein